MQFVNLTASTLIKIYQQHISPRKGFVCAYHALYPNQPSCSEAIRLSIISDGLLKAWGKSKQQFAECAAASKALARRRKRKSNRFNCCLDEICSVQNACDSCEPEIDCGEIDCGNIDCCFLFD